MAWLHTEVVYPRPKTVTHPVLTGLNVEQRRSCDERGYHYAKPRRDYSTIAKTFSYAIFLSCTRCAAAEKILADMGRRAVPLLFPSLYLSTGGQARGADDGGISSAHFARSARVLFNYTHSHHVMTSIAHVTFPPPRHSVTTYSR